MIKAICAPDTVVGAVVDMDSNIGDMMATCQGEVRRLHGGQEEIQITCVKLIGGLHEDLLRVVSELRALDEKCADMCVNWAREAPSRETRKSKKPPAFSRGGYLACLVEHSEDTPEFGKVESSLVQDSIASAPDEEFSGGAVSSSSACPLALPTGWPRSLDLRRKFKATHADHQHGMKMCRSSTLTIKHQNAVQPSIVGKYVGGVQLRDPHRGAGGDGLRSRLGRGPARLPGGLAMVWRVLLEWGPTAFHQHWDLQGRPSADDQEQR